MSRPEQSVGSDDELLTLKRVFGELDYDIGALAPETARRVRKNGKGLPEGWVAPGNKARSRIFRIGDRKIGVLVFPSCPENAAYSRISALAEKAGSKASLLIGLSPWGATREKEFLQKQPDAVDILLGSGPGPFFKGKFPGSGRTLWVRAYPEGKAVHRIDIADLERRDRKETWVPGENCSIRLIMLKQSIPRNPIIREIIR